MRIVLAIAAAFVISGVSQPRLAHAEEPKLDAKGLEFFEK